MDGRFANIVTFCGVGVSLLSFLQLVIQFAFQVLLAERFGAESEMDGVVAAISLPTVLSFTHLSRT